MGSVTFYEDTAFDGNSTTYIIKDKTYSKILLYEDAVKPIVIRSIKNYTNNEYIVALYYKYWHNAFGRLKLYIESDLNNINEATPFMDNFNVNPSFNGVMLLRKKIFGKNITYNNVESNFSKAYDDINEILDLRKTNTPDQTDTDPQPDNTIVEETSATVDPTSAPTTLSTAPVEIKNDNDQYNQCIQKNQQLERYIRHYESRNVNCTNTFNTHVLPLIKEQKKLEETVKELEKQNTELKNTTFIHMFVIIVDLLILFYILYQHNIFRPLQHL